MHLLFSTRQLLENRCSCISAGDRNANFLQLPALGFYCEPGASIHIDQHFFSDGPRQTHRYKQAEGALCQSSGVYASRSTRGQARQERTYNFWNFDFSVNVFRWYKSHHFRDIWSINMIGGSLTGHLRESMRDLQKILKEKHLVDCSQKRISCKAGTREA